MGGGGEGAEERLNSTAYNNYYVDGQWGLFRHAGAMGIITRKERLAGVDIPVFLIEPTYKACPAFHIKGMCNTGCGNAADHVPHTQEQDLSLWGWAVQEMPEIAAPTAPIAYEVGGGAECVIPVPTKNPTPSVRTRANTTPSPDTQSVTTKKKRQPMRMNTSETDAKRPTRIPQLQQVKLPGDIGKCVVCNTEEANRLGWTDFVSRRRGRVDFILCRMWITRRSVCCGNTSIAARRSC